MLKDFAKLETFLTVVREKSFSKASAKLGISQPAVTQQIKHLEDFLDSKIVDRKKNGILLTKEGEEVYRIALRVEKCIQNAEKDLFNIIDKNMPFVLGASFTLGNYILPEIINDMKTSIHNDVVIKVAPSESIIDSLLQKQYDMALIEAPIFKDQLIYREWMEDELVVVSKRALPKSVKTEDLYKFDWICRDEGSHTRKLVSETFEKMGVDCKSFNVISEVGSSTAVRHTLLKTKADRDRPVVSIMSRFVVAEDIEEGKLFESRIKNHKIHRKLYIAYSKENKHDPFTMKVIDFLLKLKKITV